MSDWKPSDQNGQLQPRRRQLVRGIFCLHRKAIDFFPAEWTLNEHLHACLISGPCAHRAKDGGVSLTWTDGKVSARHADLIAVLGAIKEADNPRARSVAADLRMKLSDIVGASHGAIFKFHHGAGSIDDISFADGQID